MTNWSKGLVGAVVLSAGCSGSQIVSRFPVETIPVPERVADYESTARSEGALGGPGADKLAAKVVEALAASGQKAETDGALASAACFALDRVHRGHPPDTVMMDAASRRYGFGGVVTGFMAFDAQTELWRTLLERIPVNATLNRLGVCASPSGHSAELVLGAMEMQFTTVAKDFEPGQPVTIRGRVGPRYTSAHVYFTRSDGSVDERRVVGADVDTTFQLDGAGQYRLEVMGDGATGPMIVANMPLYVGVVEPSIPDSGGVVVEPEIAEQRMLQLLNDERKAAGVVPLLPDQELRKLAEGHTEDMREHNFGENIAAAPTPEDANTGLMESPGHRANMLSPRFTHVGIAAAKGQAGLLMTLNFARRPRPEDVPSAAQVLQALTELRTNAGLTTPAPDPVDTAAAQAGADAMATGADDSDIAKAEAAALQRAVDRLQTSRTGGCTHRVELLDISQLKQMPTLLSPQLRRFGLGTHLRRDAKGVRLATDIMLEGVPCQ